MADESNEPLFLLLLGVAWALFSQILGEWITENLYLIETVSLLLLFGLIYEAWTNFEGQESIVNATASSGDSVGRTTAQAALLAIITGMVLFSMFLRQWVESTFGVLAAVQLLALVGILSRAFVNVRSGDSLLDFLDESRSTRVVYISCFLALILSHYLKGSYHPSSVEHNASVIFLSTAPPLVYYYFIAVDRQFKSLSQRFSETI